MKSTGQKLILLLLVLASFPSLHSLAQGNFENLNFEAANIPAGTQPGTEVSVSAAVPGWSTSPPLIYDNSGSFGSLVTIVDSTSSFQPLQGTYSVVLIGGTDAGYNYPSYISQTGLVPANTQSIQMDLAFPYGIVASAPFVVELGSQSISMSPLQTFPNYTVYGGNISAFAGQSETLTITQDAPVGEAQTPGVLEVDNIQFSPNVIPEPQTWTLLLCGAGALAAWRWKRKKAL